MNLFMWGFSNGPANIIPYITLTSSVGLFLVASCLSLFYPKASSILGSICLAGLMPFQFSLVDDLSWNSKWFLLLPLIIVLLFGLGLVNSIKVVMNYKGINDSSDLKLPVKITLILIPVSLSIWWVVGVYFRI